LKLNICFTEEEEEEEEYKKNNIHLEATTRKFDISKINFDPIVAVIKQKDKSCEHR